MVSVRRSLRKQRIGMGIRQRRAEPFYVVRSTPHGPSEGSSYLFLAAMAGKRERAEGATGSSQICPARSLLMLAGTSRRDQQGEPEWRRRARSILGTRNDSARGRAAW